MEESQSPAPEADVPQSGGEPKLDQAFAVLTEAVTQLLQESPEPPTASEVHLRMRGLTYRGFKASDLGFKRFRDFLSAAEGQGLVQIDRARQGDVGVTLGAEASFTPPSSRLAIRNDFWRAVMDWSPGVLRLYDRSQDRVLVIPERKAPLEPSKIAAIRERYAASPQDFLQVTAVDIRTQLSWMREFANAVANPAMKSLLLAALDGDRPAKYFSLLVRDSPELLHAWHETLKERVWSHLEAWRDCNDLEGQVNLARSDGVSTIPVQSSTTPKHPGVHASSELIAIARKAAATSPDRETSAVEGRAIHASQAEQELRQRVLRAIQKMPLDELRRLQIPVGYLFED